MELLGFHWYFIFSNKDLGGQIKFFEDVVGRFMLYIFFQDVTCRINRSYPLSLGGVSLWTFLSLQKVCLDFLI